MSTLALLGGKKVRNKPFVGTAIFDQAEKERVLKVLDSGMLSGFIAKAGANFLGGEQVKEFESLIRQYFNVSHAVSVNSATAGLHVALGACGIGPGDEVIVTPYTMCASATAVLMMNAIPVFADIDEQTFCIDPNSIEKRITERTKAIVAVHLFGHPAPMNRIKDIAKTHHLKIVEDCAQAPGATYQDKFVGTFGDIGIFSLNQHKTITSGEGGFAVTNDTSLALRMQLIRNHGEAVVGDMDYRDIDGIVGFNYRMTELEAAISIEQFRKLNRLNEHRIKLAHYLSQRLKHYQGLTLPRSLDGCSHVYFVYPIKFNEKVVGVMRDIFVKALQAEGIPFGAGYVRPLYLEPMYQKRIAFGKDGCPFSCASYKGSVDYSKGICPIAEKMHQSELMLTGICKYPYDNSDMDDVVSAFDKVFDNVKNLQKVAK